MITGRFGATSKRPFIPARIILPRLNVSGNLSFLMDTGADSTMLMPTDAKVIGTPYDQLVGDEECEGIGGRIHTYVEHAIIVFNDPDTALYVYEIDLDIMADDPNTDTLPSLLGRDIIDRWRITYDPLKSILRAAVRSADRIYDLTLP